MEPQRRRTIIALGSGIAAVIAATAIIVSFAIDSATTRSSSGTVEIVGGAASSPKLDSGLENSDAYTSSPVIGELAYALVRTDADGGSNVWRIPVDAPFSTMPEGDYCNPAQMTWLKEHAEPGRYTAPPIETRIRNSADTGESMSLGNIHLDGELVENSQVVHMQCGGIGAGGSQIIQLTVDGSPGVWGAPMAPDQDPQPEGSVATLNLAPGEVADVTFRIAKSTKQFIGRIVADLMGAESGSVVLVGELDYPSDTVPGYRLEIPYGDSITCVKPGLDPVQCNFAEAEELLREAGRH